MALSISSAGIQVFGVEILSLTLWRVTSDWPSGRLIFTKIFDTRLDLKDKGRRVVVVFFAFTNWSSHYQFLLQVFQVFRVEIRSPTLWRTK